MMRIRYSLFIAFFIAFISVRLAAQQPPVPPPLPVDSTGDLGVEKKIDLAVVEEDVLDWAGEGTGLSGVYEAVIGVEDLDYAMRYYGDLGFRLTGTGYLNKLAAEALYGVPSGVRSYRLQNGNMDSHGLIRLMVWDKPLGAGIGYSEPGTIGTRMMGMVTTDIYRLYDIYSGARKSGEAWMVAGPIKQDLLGDDGPRDFFERPVVTRELAVYGKEWNHLFYQRYGYTVPGYGNIHVATKLATSEVTHHDFFIRVDSMAQLSYLEKILELEADGDPSLNGDWMEGPAVLYHLKPGDTYWFQSFQSTNNVCGKLRFFALLGGKPDRSAKQRLGYSGITAHTFFTPYLDKVWKAVAEANLRPTPIMPNEFAERCFVFRGPEGATWQIIERKKAPLNEAIFYYHLQLLDE
ncbi:MAG: hypothetical protein KA479_10025 [Saprospiraceae bacterium]|nr:hypothetical protein [Saprospiraceae bacterium]